MKKLTPVLISRDISECVPFWEKIGFKPVTEVPGESGKLQFVILVKDDVEVMYQSKESVARDMPELQEMNSSGLLYIEVSDLDFLIRALDGVPIAIPRRKTFYGADEIGFFEPSGSVVLFSMH